MQFEHHSVGALVAVAIFAGCASGDTSAGLATEALTGFEAGVVAANHPEGVGAYGVWYDTTHNTFGTPSASTLAGAPAMRIDDAGFTNGVYSIFPAEIPADGTYRVEVEMHVVESGATAFDGVRAYQIGVTPGGTHRGLNPSALAGMSAVGSYPALTTGDDTAIGPVTVSTAEFEALAGDDLAIAFATDVSSGTWAGSSAFWNGAYVLVGTPRLVPVAVDPSIVVDDDEGAPAFERSGPWALGGSSGHRGGSYQFASSGGASQATWTASLAAGFYRVEVTYLAGANRTDSAHYVVEDGSGVLAERVVDQRYRSLSWVRLGIVEVALDGEVRVSVDAADASAGSVLIADAVRFFPLDGPPAIDPAEVRLATITVFDDIDDVGAIQAVIDEIEALHYNSVAVHARYRGDATYVPNRVDSRYPNHEPRSAAAGDVDVLAEFVERGHRAGLRVFAYVNTHLVTDGSRVPTDPAHVVNEHPEWRTYAYAGGTPVMQELAHDAEGLWLDPALPQVRRYLADIAGDIASNYDIDGVVLDRIRYPQTGFTREARDFGYHPEAIRLFRGGCRGRGRDRSVPDPRDPEWIAFRQRAVTDTVGAIHDRLEDIDPSLMLLAFPIGRLSDALTFNYQDWPSWLDQHRIDGVLPQIYTADTAVFSAALRDHLALYDGDRVLAATIDGFRAGVDIEGQIEEARLGGFDGTSPFRHGTLAVHGYLEPLQRAWDGVAPFPAMPWKGRRIRSLEVREVCSRDRDTQTWEIEHDNAESLAFEWSIRRGDAAGSGRAVPGSTMFTTPRTSARQSVIVTWYDDRGRVRSEVASECRWYTPRGCGFGHRHH